MFGNMSSGDDVDRKPEVWVSSDVVQAKNSRPRLRSGTSRPLDPRP
jgi:hypothetical protein